MRDAVGLFLALVLALIGYEGAATTSAYADAGAPTVSAAADGWHVNAVLPGTSLFTFVIKVTGEPDRYFGGQRSPFLVDPVTYGGKAVFVNARADSSRSNLWGRPGVGFTVAPAKPAVTVAADNWHVNAVLAGTDRFTFVVKSAGTPDTYFGNQTSPFAIDRERFGGREVTVAARADSSPSLPWTAAAQRFIVPTIKRYGVADILDGGADAPSDATAMGATINRIDFDYGDAQADMDSLVAANTSNGLNPLIILNQHGSIAQFNLDGWRQWASSVVARYGPNGTFWAGRTDAHYAPVYFEVLNEPYGWWFNQPVDAAAYTHFFAEVVTAAKTANPKAKFLMAGLPNTFKINEGGPWSTATWDTALKGSPDGTRAQSLADGVTVHPYGSYTSAAGWQSAIGTHHDFPQLPVWITEVGYRICMKPDDTGCSIDGVRVTEAVQAQWLTRNLNDFLSWPWAAAFIWFKWTDYYGPDPDNAWGLVRWADRSHRPSYAAYQNHLATHPAAN